MKTNKIILISSLVLVASGVGFWLWKRAKNKKEVETIQTQYSLNENLALVKQKLGDSGVIAPNPNDKKANDLIYVYFNDKKNFAHFFGGGTFFIFDNTVKPPKQLVNGTYAKGGTNIKLSNGKEIKNNDVLTALQETLKY